MGNCNIKGRCKNELNAARPVTIGLLAGIAVTLALIAVFSLVFLALESIAKSAVVPLALVSAAVGCFCGAFVCAKRAKRGGMLFGAVIGAIMFLLIWLLSMLFKQHIFGTVNIVKILLLVGSGVAGGYLGGKKKRGRR